MKLKLKSKNFFRPIAENSDGYHTFNELYAHRAQLFIALCHAYPQFAWKSLKHSDGTCLPGWFIAGLFEDDGQQITYHLLQDKWSSLKVKELAQAPEYDGHTSKDVLIRLEFHLPNLVRGGL